LRKIADKVVPETITLKEVLEIPDYHATLKVQIYNNKIYTNKEITEERNIQIMKQLSETLKYHSLPNTVFAYCTQDHTPDINCLLFTHAIQPYTNNRNIPAPCFTFDEYSPTSAIEKISHENAAKSLYENSKKYMDSYNNWDKKEDKVTFVGLVNDDNDRIENTRFTNLTNNIEQMIINTTVPVTSENYISRDSLASYKYLLT